MAKPIVLWKGYHGPEIAALVRAAWDGELRLICYPPGVDDVSFLPQLPAGPISFRGEWDSTPPLVEAGTTAPDYPEDPRFGLFSSGTVGRKLVLTSKRNAEASLDAILSLFEPSRLGAIFCYPQPFHTFGLMLGYVHAVRHGRELLAANGRYGSHQHELRHRMRRPDLLTLGTPTHFHDWRHYARERGTAPAASYAAILGGAPVTPELWHAIKDELHIEAPSIGYGATEASPGVTHLPPGRAPVESGEIGFPLPHLAVERLPNVGVKFSGASTCLAMIQNGKITFPESITLSDDVSIRPDGVWTYRGRLEHVLNRGGEKFPLASLEAALRGKLGVEAVCVAVPDGRLGEELGVVIESEGNVEEAVYEVLFDTCQRDFSRKWFRAVETLPRTDNAKIDRTAARSLLEDRDET